MTKFAIGCLVQWYEVKIIDEYISSIRSAIKLYDKSKVQVDFALITNQILEKFDGKDYEFEWVLNKIVTEFEYMRRDGYVVNITTHPSLYSIADYRRDFNEKYCESADVLIWGESDMLAPKQMFVILDQLHRQVVETTPKYLSFFGGCKMWDDSWKLLEHPKFSDKPFIDGDTENWWSLRYTM